MEGAKTMSTILVAHFQLSAVASFLDVVEEMLISKIFYGGPMNNMILDDVH